jgi:hypothetical protein
VVVGVLLNDLNASARVSDLDPLSLEVRRLQAEDQIEIVVRFAVDAELSLSVATIEHLTDPREGLQEELVHVLIELQVDEELRDVAAPLFELIDHLLGGGFSFFVGDLGKGFLDAFAAAGNALVGVD